MTEERRNPANEQFVRDLRRVLYRLYDPTELRRSPLFPLFSVEHGGSPSALRDLIIEAITRLKPPAGVSAESDAWRTYRLLLHRFVEQFDQTQVAADLGLSIRQIRRQESQALQTLADALWRRFNLQARSVGSPAAPRSQGSADHSPPVQGSVGDGGQEAVGTTQTQELSWLGRSLPLEPADVGDLIRATLGTAGSLLADLGVQAICDLPAGLPRVIVQVGPIRQTLLILLNEAIRSAPAGQLILAASAEPQQVVISVHASPADHGSAGGRPGPESGRLEMAQRLAALSAGSLRILPESDGAGFAARLSLPCARPTSVLFIDDNADAHQLFQRYLAGTRYAYIGGRDAEQALVSAETAAPQVIVLDVMLPHVDGWELLGRLRTHPQTREIPVIVCTILPLEQLAFRLGAAAFLQKPVTRETLLAALDQQMSAVGKGSR
jgi:CheY-like chemotaxis protein